MKEARKDGFTLVELLVVIAIIGILIRYCCRPSTRASAGRRASCSNNIKQLALALNNHLSSYNYLPPRACRSLRNYASTSYSSDYSVWYEATQTTTGFSSASWMVYHASSWNTTRHLQALGLQS